MADIPALNTGGINVLPTLNFMRQSDLADAQQRNLESEIATRTALASRQNALLQIQINKGQRESEKAAQDIRKTDMELLGKSFDYLTAIKDPEVLKANYRDFSEKASSRGFTPVPDDVFKDVDEMRLYLKSASRGLRGVEAAYENSIVKVPVYNKFFRKDLPYDAVNSPVIEVQAVMRGGVPDPIKNPNYDSSKPPTLDNYEFVGTPLVGEGAKLQSDIESNKARLEETKASRRTMQGNRDREFGLSIEKENRVSDSQLANHYTQITLNKDNPALAGEVEVFNNNSRGFEVFIKKDTSVMIPGTDRYIPGTAGIKWEPVPTPSVTMADPSGKLVTSQVPAYKVAEVAKKYNMSMEKAVEFIIQTDKEVAALRAKGVKK
jgi:hypothetical protein